MTKISAKTMEGKNVLVTGGTGGIGKATAIELAKLGARVGIVGRDNSRAEKVALEIKTIAKDSKVDIFTADMSSLTNVRRLAANVLETYARLDVLINNVGGLWSSRHVTVDGFERSLALNHLAPFLLTMMLLDRLRKSSPSRIVMVSSKGHANGRINFEDLQSEHNHSGERAYAQSKLANLMFTYELARRLDGTGVTANALHPGVVGTMIGDDDPMWYMPIIRLLASSPEKGAATSVYLASSPEVQNVTGKYFVKCKPTESAKLSHDVATSERLWQVSEQLVGLESIL